MQHLFLIDPLASLNRALDSSLRMAYALHLRGHAVRIAEPRQLSWDSHQGPRALCAPLLWTQDAASAQAGDWRHQPLSDFAAIHMRKDPPYDLEYITATWLLDAAQPQAVVFNNPQALRSINEKVSILRFPQACRPALVSANPDEIIEFIRIQAQGDGIIKPLTLFGGRGVQRVELGRGEDTALRLLADATNKGTATRLVQAFDPAVFAGEVRVFTAFAEPIAWCLKTPAPGQFLANTRAGASLSAYQPTPIEEQRVRAVATTLLQEGVSLIGFDLIGGFVSEINITSPRLLVGDSHESAYYAKIATLMEQSLRGAKH